MSIKQAAAPVCVVTAIIALVASWGQVRTNAEGLALIGNTEGCLREPYRCPAGRLTDGIGNTHGVKPGTHKTDQQIAADWQRNILDAEHCINSYFRGHGMSANTFSAMTSAAFTTGCYGLRTYRGKDGQRHETTLHKLAKQLPYYVKKKLALISGIQTPKRCQQAASTKSPIHRGYAALTGLKGFISTPS